MMTNESNENIMQIFFALFITFPVNDVFKTYLENVFGAENIMTYGEFMRLET